jgi:hypothetical protein
MMQPIQETQSKSEDSMNPLENWIINADQILTALEQDQALGPTIRRFASDLATVIGNLAREWEDADDTKKRLWARSCLEEARNQLELKDESSSSANNTSTTVATLSEDEWVQQVSIAKALLLDIEESLKSISADEADEIADVALVVLRIFLKSLKQFYHPLDKSRSTTTVQIEVLEQTNGSSDHIGTITNRENNHIITASAADSSAQVQKARLLWPPMGPTMTQAAIWGKDMAMKKPILSIALAMTLWPTVIVAGFIGATDWVLQSTYNRFQDHPLIENLEMGAHNLLDIAKLYFLCSKLVIKQGIRVGKRQIDRRGGIEQTLKDIGSWTLERVLHPVETVTLGTQAVLHGVGVVQEIIQAKNHPRRNTGVLESNVHFKDCT